VKAETEAAVAEPEPEPVVATEEKVEEAKPVVAEKPTKAEEKKQKKKE
jgi:hypothetical protein